MSLEVITPNHEQYVYHALPSHTLKFSVLADNDAHIILSQTVNPTQSNHVIEIFLGGWNNTASGIRRNFSQPDVAHISTPNLLSRNGYRRFWINFHGGVISVGRDDEVTPLMLYTDPMPFNINYFGFRTGHGSTGDWIVNGERIFTSDNLLYNYRPVPRYCLEVFVEAPHDAHIALTTGPKDTRPMYEIFLGGWDNTASAIRHNQTPGREEVKMQTPNLLSPIQQRYFRISWTNGLIQVHTQNDFLLMQLHDPMLFSVSHFGVRTWHGATGRWNIRVVEQRGV